MSESAFSPDWSPTGPLIAFVKRVEHHDAQITVARPDGSHWRQLTHTLGTRSSPGSRYNGNYSPSFAPGGRRIVYVGNDGPEVIDTYRICIVHIDGSHNHCITEEGGDDRSPSFSPGGHRIVFLRGGDIWVMQDDGTHQRNLTHSTSSESYPAWSPDGKQIGFLRLIGNQTELFVIRSDGTGLRRLTDTWGSEQAPDWAPATD
jgi:TolB protein